MKNLTVNTLFFLVMLGLWIPQSWAVTIYSTAVDKKLFESGKRL